RAYALILAAGTLVVGGKDTVTAIAADTGRLLWQDKVKGQARSLTAANGRLLASTTEGRVYCYGPTAAAEPPVISAQAGPPPSAVGQPELEAARTARGIIVETGKKAGICVVLGAGDGRLLHHLAKQSDLVVYCAEPDAGKADAARQALDADGLYGVRVTVHQGTLGSLGYPDYVADLVVAGGTPMDLQTWSAEHVYRVLRPYGGCARIALAEDEEASRTAIVSWLERGNVPEDEVKAAKGAVQIVRGPLPGAGNWTHQYASAARTGCSDDQRVRLPLRLLWFGEPGPARLVTRHWGGPAPLCVNGRMFVIGQRSLMATDAYNGRHLWRRDFPSVAWWPIRSRGSSAAADADSVYLVQGQTCLRLDAATGQTVQTYRMPAPPAETAKETAEKLDWSYLAVGRDRVLGSMGGRTDARCVFLLGKDGKPRWTYAAKGVVDNNALSMDEGRVYVIDRTSPGDVDRAKRRGQKIAAGWTLLALDAQTGKTLWQTDEGIRGHTALWLSEGVLLATGSSGMTGYAAADGKLLYARPARIRRFPVIAGETVYTEPAAYDLRTGYPHQRTNPFTGGQTAWEFRRSYGCGAISAGPNLLMFRSGTLGMYDLAGDGGVFNFGGVRAGCYVNAIAANGLVLAPPADAACTCSYSLRTTVALMPAHEERNWSVFYDRLPTTPVTQGAFNLGAPGDRRDPAKTIWLALPRPVTRTRRSALAEPFRFTFHEGFGAYSHNTDRTPVAGTDRPWIYASGLKGLRRAELDLEILDRGVAAWPARAAPTVDGNTAEVCWDGYKTVALAGGKASVTLRHDDENLYVAYARPAAKDPKEKPVRWKAATKGNDAQVWRDDSFEAYLSALPRDAKAASARCLHLGVSASGARYDALWTYATPRLAVRDIGRLDAEIDGTAGDWGEKGLAVTSLPGPLGRLRAESDFDASFRIGWNEKGLLLLAEVKDNVVHEWEEESALTLGDSVEIFLAPKPGAREGYRCVLTPGPAPKHEGRCHLSHFGKTKTGGNLAADVSGRRTPDGYVLEALLPWTNLGMAPRAGDEVAMQLIVTDDDRKGDRHRFRALWHQAGDPQKDPFAYQRFRLAAEPGERIAFKRGAKKDRDGFFGAVPPHPLPVSLAPLGADGEKAEHSAAWSSAVRADGEAFIAELAVPWKTLTDAGLGGADLMIDLESRGPLRQPPLLGRGFERLIVVPEAGAAPKTLSVRLHFAELDDTGPGERVFDVRLQGKTVLKDFDVVKAAGGRGRAVVKQFDGVVVSGALALELAPKAKEVTASTAPILSGIEVTAEGR
ncbi:MAG TPA: PQQ-binding-like beta-propeller repeat protein, partial [Phycisphaerae bacterium]|nr:PQQ-binding-like beta-propeller repeat protein [Phycisphaerae bacterium]